VFSSYQRQALFSNEQKVGSLEKVTAIRTG